MTNKIVVDNSKNISLSTWAQVDVEDQNQKWRNEACQSEKLDQQIERQADALRKTLLVRTAKPRTHIP